MPILPDYDSACVTNIIPESIRALMGQQCATWMPDATIGAKKIVLLVLDGLGYQQFERNLALMPTLASFERKWITTVAPSTSATALLSIVTSQSPGRHGIVGYEMLLDGELFNSLKWTIDGNDVRDRVVPTKLQVHPSFAANSVPVVTQAHFFDTGFTQAQFQDDQLVGYHVPSAIPLDVWKLCEGDNTFVYVYYNGIDKAAHAYGFGEYYSAEIFSVDRIVRDLIAGLPRDCVLLVASDHGQVEVGPELVHFDDDIRELCWQYSGEGRFRWLHAHDGRSEELLEKVRERYGDVAWVMSRDEVLRSNMFGTDLPDYYQRRFGEVAVIASAPVSFANPLRPKKHPMLCQHGSLTQEEMQVPLLAYRA